MSKPAVDKSWSKSSGYCFSNLSVDIIWSMSPENSDAAATVSCCCCSSRNRKSSSKHIPSACELPSACEHNSSSSENTSGNFLLGALIHASKESNSSVLVTPMSPCTLCNVVFVVAAERTGKPVPSGIRSK